MSKEFLTREQAYVKLGENPGSLTFPHNFINKTETEALGGDADLLLKYAAGAFPVDDDIVQGNLIAAKLLPGQTSNDLFEITKLQNANVANSVPGGKSWLFVDNGKARLDILFKGDTAKAGLATSYQALIIEYNVILTSGNTKPGCCDVLGLLNADRVTNVNVCSVNPGATTYPEARIAGVDYGDAVINNVVRLDDTGIHMSVDSKFIAIYAVGNNIYGYSGSFDYKTYTIEKVAKDLARKIKDNTTTFILTNKQKPKPIFTPCKLHEFAIGGLSDNDGEGAVLIPPGFGYGSLQLIVRSINFTKPLN